MKTPLPPRTINQVKWNESLNILAAGNWINSAALDRQYGWVPHNLSTIGGSLVNEFLHNLERDSCALVHRAKHSLPDRPFSGDLQFYLIEFLQNPMLNQERFLVGLSPSELELMNDALRHPPNPNQALDKPMLSKIFANLADVANYLIQAEFKHPTKTTK